MIQPKILGISCSLRNARFGAGSERLIEELKSIHDEKQLANYLARQVSIRAEDFMAAGRAAREPFDEIYRKLKKLGGDRGLSNSEASLAAALWGSQQCGAEIAHIGLARYFPANGEWAHSDELRNEILSSDAFIMSTPIYFGDRSSVAQEFIEFLRKDDQCREHIFNKVYGGIAVGAKRNGGQETTLVYQMVDFSNLNALCVGNDSETTSQYGGTAHAGDVGTLHKDEYGINTSIGTGRRVARVSQILKASQEFKLREPISVSVVILQDDEDHHGRLLVEKFCNEVNELQNEAVFKLSDYTQEKIYRCIACDICPTHKGDIKDYRCIIKSEDDLFKRDHENIVAADAIILAAYSPTDRHNIRSVYQRFIERTRYLRRDDYIFTNKLVAPFVISEIDSNQNLHIRMLTSLIRHHTVLHRPLIAFELGGKILNWKTILQQAVSFAENANSIIRGQLGMDETQIDDISYKPIGYIISTAKEEEDIASGLRGRIQSEKREAHSKARHRRLSK